MMYVLDTCVLLWWTLDPENLSPLAAKHCKNIDTQGACIASVSLWEIGVKIQKGKLNIGMPIRSFVKLLSQVNMDGNRWLKIDFRTY